tara:strand:- start:154 stop:588 length:435 start_codon:yes stop_codon:yes gene_type:complete
MIKDIGKFLGIYFYIIACIQLIVMFLNQYLTGDIDIRLSSLVYFVVGYYLFNHNIKTRKIVLVFSGIGMLLQFSIFIYLSIKGIPETAHIRLLGIEVSNFVSVKNIPIFFFLSIIIPAIPYFLLRTKQAMTEFSNKEEIEISNP